MTKQLGEGRGSKERRLTERQERFAAAYVANGGNASEAYRAAYDSTRMSNSTIAVEASRLRNHPKVAQRIDELRTRVLAERGVDLGAWVRRVTDLAFGDIGDVCEWDANSLTVKPLASLTKEQLAMIKSIKRIPGRFGERVEITLHEPARYLELLGHYLGVFKDQAPAPQRLDSATERLIEQMERLPPEELRELLEAQLELESAANSAR